MKVLHKAKQLLQGFVLPGGLFSPRHFLPTFGSKNQPKGRSIFDRAKRYAPLALGTGIVLSLVMNFGVPQAPANASNCHVGSSASCPATSPLEIFNLYGTTTNAVYWLNVAGTPREVFVVMDTSTSWGGGYWILLMKGARGTSNFGYTSNLFTSNSTVLNESSPARDFTSDAKYHAYNSISLSQMLAVISSPERGSISNQGDIANNSFGGHTWLESAGNETAFARLTTSRSLNNPDNLAFGSVPVQKYRQSNSNGSTQVFSYQTGTGRYGHANECDPNGYKTRWGIIWNNETNQLGSCDAFVGIGAQSGGLNISPRDQVTYNDALTVPAPSANNNGGLGQFAFQIWGKMATPSQTAPAQPTVVNAALGAVTVSWTAPAGSPTNYVVQYKLTSDSSWGTNPSQSVVVSSGTSTTITGLSNSTSYDFRVMARTATNSSAPSAVRSHTITPRTISFNNNGGTGTMSTLNVADSASTSLTANSFTRDGHTFRGWNTLASGLGTNYSDQQAISTSSNLTLYAMWTSLEDRAWNKVSTSGNYASATAEVIPVATNAEWTVEAWVNPTAASASSNVWYAILGQQNGPANRYSIWMNNNNLHLTTPSDNTPLAGGSGNTVLSYVLQSSRWTHIAWAMSTGQNSKLYIDGTLVWQANLTRTTAAGSLFTVGGTDQADGEFPGHIDQVKVWGAQLTLEQINTSMHTHGTFSGAPTLRAHYDFNEFNSGALLDRSGNNRHLTLPAGTVSSEFTSSAIVETGTAHSLQTFVKFNRSYLTAAGGWTPPPGTTQFKALVVGGGGAGGTGNASNHGGGGGGGGQVLAVPKTVTTSALRIQVGQGGEAAANQGLKGLIGGGSVLGTNTALGGGGGAGYSESADASWTGGGGAAQLNGGNVARRTGASPTAGRGYKGGDAEILNAGGGGGAGGAGLNHDDATSGSRGGLGIQSAATGSQLIYGAGGGGGRDNASGSGGTSSGPGAGGGAGITKATPGANGSGAGGGGGSGAGGANWRGAGSGGSGVVIISYGAIMDVTQEPGGARAGSVFQRPITIQLKNSDGTNYTGANQQVTLTAASGSTLQQTIGGVTTNITSTTTTSRDGVATFSNIGFQSGVGSSAQTLTVTADAFVGTSLSVTPTFVATSISITNSGTTAGQFIDGVFQANGASATNIRADDLVSAMTARNISIESSGNITVSTAVTNATAGRSLTLNCGAAGAFTNSGGAINIAGDLTVTCAGVRTDANLTAVGSIRLTGTSASSLIELYSTLTTTGGATSEIRLKTVSRFLLDVSDKLITAGGDVVVWTGYDKVAGTNKSSTAIYLNSSSSIETNGGKIWLGGGLDDGGADASITTSRGKWSSVVADDGFPDGYAVGIDNSNEWRIGVFLERDTLLNSKGGDIFIAGAQGPTSSDGYGHILLNPGTRVDSGTGRIAMWGRALTGSTNWSQGIALNYGDNSNPVVITSNATTSDAISIYSDSQAGNACSRGITGWWHGVLSGSRGWQGTQILATGLGGGISMTGLGSTSTSCSGGDGWGINLEFADVLARSGPITVNAIGNSNGTTPGLATGWRANEASLARFGAWAASGTGAVGGASITTPGGVTADFSSSSSNVVINTSSVYSWEAGYGTVINTSGSVAIQPATATSGVVSSATNFTRAHTDANWRFGRFSTPTRMASFTLGRSGSTSNLTYMGTSSAGSSPIQTAGNVAIDGGNLLISSSINSNNGSVAITSNAGLTVSAAVTSSGDVTYRAGAFANNESTTSNNGNVLLQADDMTLSTTANINIAAPLGSVTIAPQTNSRVIDLGTDVVGRLSLTALELNRISTSTLRIGALGGTNTGNIDISSAISPALTPTLALRTGGAVSSSGNRSITETNLGVQASGSVSLAASNVISGNLALNSPASSLTFNQSSGSFTPGTVDGITPEYGVPSTLTVVRVPTTQTENRTLGEVFSLVPEVTIRDEFSNTLITANSQSSRYSITVTRASGSGTLSGTLVRSTTAGVASFDNLRIITTPGAHTLTFTATAVSAPALIVGSPSATTGTYNIRTAQTITFTSMINRTMGATNTFTVEGTASSGLAVAFTSDTAPVCTTSGTNGTTVTMITGGTCRINANQAGDTSYAPATQVQQSFTVSRALELTTPLSGLTGTFNSAYTLTLARSGGASPYTFALDSGTLPAGLTIESSTGVIRGTPSAASTQTVTVRVTDANNSSTTTSSFAIAIAAAPLSTPATPTSLATVGTLGSIGVSWSAVANASSYTVRVYDSTGTSLRQTISDLSGSTLTINSGNFSGIADGTNYKISVAAVGTGNYSASAESNQSSITTNVKHTFDPNGASGSATEQVSASGANLNLTPNSFSRTSHTFRGWNTLADGTGTSFTDGQATSITANRTLYAMWSSLDDRAVDLAGNANASLSGPTGVIPAGAFTVESWVYLRSNVNQTVLSEGASSSVYIATLYNGELYVRWGGQESAPTTGVVAPINRWVHLALTRDATGAPSLFIDGVRVWNSATISTLAPTNTGPFRVGIQVGNSSFLNGQVDQVKVWNVALTASELVNSMHSYAATQSGGSAVTSQAGATLRAHYDFNEVASSRLELDRSGNGRNLTYGSALSSSSFTSNQILETSTAHSLQTYVKFNRSYLTAAGGWTPPNGVTSFKALVAGGGGAGGSRHAGGGGAGALLWSDNTSISGVTRIQVGQGALGITTITDHNGNLGGQSGQSSFLGTSELKGGGGGAGAVDTAKTGGSSGGLAGTGSAVAAGSGLGLKNAGGVGANGTHNGSTQYTGGGGGGAQSAGITSTASAGGQGGSGFVSNITGQAECYAAGGGGGATSGATGAAGGACTSGQVTATVATSAGAGTNASYTGTIAGSGASNSGSGGGAGGFNSTSGRSGGGGSGVVILSYGPSLDVTRTATAARAGSNFSQSIQVTAGNGAAEHDVTITATGQVLRVGVGGSAVTAVTVRTVGGVATFTDLGFTSNVGAGARTLTFSSDAFMATTLTITPSQTASTVNITSSGTTDGVFVNGNFESSTSGTANILNTDLQTHLQSFSTTIESSGTISVQASVSSSAAGSGLTLKTAGDITVVSNQNIRTNGGHVVLWSDSDASSAGVIRLLHNSQICTTSGTCSTTSIGGGDVILGGGSADPNNSLRPGGFASGYGTTYATDGTTTTTGVQIGTMGPGAMGSRIYSAGGNIQVRGSSTTENTSNVKGGAFIMAGSEINSGNGSMVFEFAYRSPEGTHGSLALDSFGVAGSTSTFTSTRSSATSVVIRTFASGLGNQNNIGIWGATGFGPTFNLSGGLQISAARINESQKMRFNVAGPVVIQPYETTLRGDYAKTSYTLGTALTFMQNPTSITIGSSANTSPITISQNLQASTGDIQILTSAEIVKSAGFNLTAGGEVFMNSRSSNVTADTGAISSSNLRVTLAGAYSGAASLTASNGVLQISGGTSVAPTGALQASGNILISGSGNITTATSADIASTAGSVSITSTGATVTLDRSVSAATAISLTANRLALGATIGTTSASGVVTIAPHSNSTVIDLGTEVSNRLSLTTAEVNRVSAGTLRIGALNGTNSGNINVTAAIAPTGVQTLALRTSGSVESSGSGSITEVNLAISAAYINLQGNNSITGNLALSSANATLNYNQISGSFTPATVDQVTPEYGIANQISMSQVPTSTAVDRMMAVAFNPPPTITLQDKFGNELTTANSQSTSYTVTATKASGPGNLTGNASTTTSTRGVARFTNLSISDSSGVHRITFTATVTATSAQISGTPSATTGDYNIKIDQTVSFTSTAPTSARASGSTYTATATASSGLSPTITVDASATSVCSVSSGVVSFLAAGTCVLNANQSGNSTFTAAQQVQQSFAVASAKLDTPQAPTVVATANTLKSLEVSWIAIENAASYQVKVYTAATGPESYQVLDITGTSTRIRASEFQAMADSTLYYVSVKAIASSSERNSDESLKGTGTTNSPAVAPRITFQPTGVNMTVGQSATLRVGATADNGVLGYQWQKDGSNISGATSSTLTRNPVAEADAGSYSVVVTNTLNGTTATTNSSAVSLTVARALTITTPSSGLSATVNSAYSLSLTATGGRASLSFSTSSTLPTGITLSSAGVLSGTPTQSGTFALVVTVTDLNSATATTSSFNLAVASAPGLVPTFATPVSSISGATDRLSVQITNYNASYTWSGTASIGTVTISNTGLITFSGVSSGQTTTATITTARTHYLTTSAAVSATLTPIPVISYNSSDLNSYDTDSVVRDLSGRGNNGSAVNGVDIVGSSGSWNFTGGTNSGGDYIDLPDLSTSTFSSGITIDFEADFASGPGWERILDFSTTSLYVHGVVVYRVGLTDSFDIVVYRNSSYTQCTVPEGTITSGLNRYTIMLNSSSCLAYKNGTLVLSESKNMSLVASQTLTNNYLGRSNRTNETQFEGEIRSLRLYAGTPTFNQIGAISYKTLSYNSDGGSAVAATTRTTTSGETLLASTVSRTGYSFLGWYDSTNTLTRTKIGDAAARYTPSSNIALFAGWDANTLNVTFNSNSGSLVTSTTTRTGEQLAAPADPTRLGYTFAGWYANSNLTDPAVSFPYTHGQTANFTLWAKWAPDPFTVTFVTGGGSAVTDFTTRTAEALPNSFTTTRAGYNFDGWFTDSNFSQSAVSFPYTHGQVANFTLYAKWSAKTLTVSFNSNGGSTVTAATTRTAEAFSTTATSTRAGYTFEGWFASGTLTGSRITSPHIHGQTDNFTLYAKWDAVNLAVDFQSNGGTAVTSTTVRTDQQISSAPVEPTRTGYTFAGWYDNFGLTGNALTFPHTHGRTSNIILYAKWTPNVNTITFDANFVGGSTRTQLITTGVSTALTANVFTRTGYTFDGWSRNDDGTGTNYTNQEVVGVTGSFTLYAKWSANTLNVTFNTNSGSAITTATTRTGLQFTSTATTTRAGYTFLGWFDNEALSGSAISFPYTHGRTANFTLYAKWDANTLDVSFNTNSGTAVTATTTRTTGVLPNTFTTTRAGYTFMGWFDNDALAGAAISFPYTHGKTANFTLYAKWDANTLNVSFNTNSGSAVTATTTRTAAALPTSFTTTRAGYTFMGWFDNAEFSGSAISFPYTHGKTSDFTLFAKWDANTLNVSFNSNSGTAVTATTVRAGQQIPTSFTTTRAGYTFLGWFDNEGLTGSAISFPYTHGKTSDFTLFAKWDANILNVSFNSNLGSAVTATTTRTAAALPTTFTTTRAGYTFLGWFDNEGFAGSAIAFPHTHGKTSDFTLFAKWDANTLNVSFNTNSGAAVTATTTRTAETLPTTVTTTRPGYTFMGWFDNAELSGSAISFPYTHGKTADFTLFAKWDAKVLNVTLDTNSGSGVTNTTTRTAASLPTTFTTTRAGYAFAGWFDNASFTGSAISFPYTHGKTEDFTLYAKWDANTLNVNFITNSGTAVTAVTTRTGNQIPTSFTTTRTGHTFLGWFDNAEFSGSAISFPYAHTKTADFTLYAKWDANALTVSFDSNSGSSVTATSTRTGEQILSAPTDPTRVGYTFAGWFDNNLLFGSRVAFPYTHAQTSSFTLYAKWEANTLNVSFESNSGSAVTATTTRTGEQITTAPVSPSRTGYTFAGWFDNIGLTGSQVGFPYAHGKTANFTLYAKWTANDLTVSYVSNGGAAVTATQTRTAETISGAPTAPTRAGYNFLGWFDNAELTGSVISFPYTHGQTGDFTLYAKWEAKTLTVSFNSSSGSAVSSTTTRTAESILSAPTPPSRAGYNFLGWVENGDLSGSVVDFPYTHGKTGDFTLYAKWDANTLSVSFDTNGGVALTTTTVRTDGQITSTITTTRAGYAFVGWFDNADLTGSVVTFPYTHGKTANFTLFAKWTANTLNVTFDTNSGTAVTATTTRTGQQFSTTATTTRAGYTFAGWFDNVGLTGSQATFPYTHGKTANFTLYAKWTPNTLNVRFELNDGTGNFESATTTTGSEVAAPANNPTHPGFEFMGWSATEGGSALTFPYLHGRTTDFTLHAVWKAGNYTVLYQYNGATGGNSVASTSYTTDIVRTGIELPVPIRTAYTFTGWRSDISLATPLELKPNGRFVPTVNQTVYAKWTPVDYTVTYNYSNSDSGSVPVDSRLYNIGQSVSLLANSGLLGRTGYTFAGWVTSPSGTGSELNSGQTVTVASANINFYPKWTARTYSISYNLNGGTGSLSGAPVSWTVGTSNVTLPSSGFTRTGYNFAGWSRTAGGSVVSNSFSNNFVDESLTAVWTLKNIGYTFAPGAASSQGITRWPANSSNTFGTEITLPDLNGEIAVIGSKSYEFFGWGDGSATYRSGQKYVLGESAPQFTAQWVELLDVRYSFGGGTKAISDLELDNKDAECVTGGLCALNQEITLRDAPTRLGYTFAGWKTETDSGTVLRPAGTKTVIRNDNFLFFAEWTPVDYNFSFNSLGGSNNFANRTGNIGRILTMPDPGIRTGYTFSGWSSDGGVTKYAAGPTFVIGSASVGFEATWVPDVYQISFDWQGGIGSPQPNASFTVGRGPMTLPVQGDRVKDGYNFSGWSTTPGGAVVSNYEPTANGVLFAKWDDGNYTISFNAQNGPTPVTDVLVQRGTSASLRTPTRPNFRFLGWFDSLTGGNFVGAAGANYLPTASKTLYARWVQSSFFGVDEAALETATTYTASSSQGIDTTITHNPSGSQARIQIPAGTLPDGTVVSVRYFKDVTRQRSVIGETNNYFFSVVVSWLLGSGATATVPDTLFDANGNQKPITVTLSNTQIKAGAMVYQIVDGVYTPLQRATVDGSITVRIFSDPELVVAATPPTAPLNVLVVGPGRGSSTVSWLAPQSNGGSPLTNYNVYLDGVLACSAITALSCDLTNLSDSNTYNVRVVANNAVGSGEEATTSFTTQAAPSSGSGGGAGPGPVPPAAPVVTPKPVVPPKPAPPAPAPVASSAPAPAPTPSETALAPVPPIAAPVEPTTPGVDPGANTDSGSTEGGASIGATGDDNAPPVPFDPLASPEAVEALTDTLGNAAAAVGAIAAAAGAAAAAAGAAAGAAGAAAGGGGAAGGSRAPAGGSSGGSGGSGEGGSIATIDAAHERYRNKRRGRGDRWKLWKKKWLTFADSPFIKMIVRTARFSPLFSKIAVDGAYLRAAFGSFGLLPTIAAALIALGAVAVNDSGVAAPHWQWFIVLAVIGIFDAFAGLIGTVLFVIGTIVMHGSIGLDDIRLLLGVIIVGYGPSLLANAFRAFRKEPEDGDEYWWERLVDLVVLPFIGGWVTATMISTLPALAGSTLAVANHVGEFGIAIAIAITARVLLEEFVARMFPARLDTLHPTDVDDPAPIQKWISVAFRLSVFIFVTAALMGNVWQVWVGSALFILPTIIGFYSHKFRNYPWIWRILPTGIPGLAFALIVASVTTSVVGILFGTSPDLALWSFALLPIPMLGLSILGMLGREGNEGEVRWIRRPGFKWVYRIGGIFMLLATMELAGVLDIFPF